MAQRMFGVETEYAFSVVAPRGPAPDREIFLGQLLDRAREKLPNLSGMYSGGIFLSNGSRLYRDCGHPELATPEVVNPWDVCRYVQAGEKILADLAVDVSASAHGSTQVLLSRCNVCYGGTHATWGHHESHSHRANPSDLAPHLIPHLVSRLIYAGAGGFSNLSPGLVFTLAPRVFHLTSDVSDESTRNRGIYHTRDEPLSLGGYHRLHILCGESLCSEAALWLKLGATSLVLALTEAGLRPGQAIQLQSPLEAMRAFASDPECKVSVLAARGKRWTAIAIQRHYLEQAQQHLSAPFMPRWAPDVCQFWERMLTQLEQGPSAVETTLDWSIKLSLYKRRCQSHGFSWESLTHWTQALTSLHDAMRSRTQESVGPITQDVLLPGSPVSDEVDRLRPWLRDRGLDWNDLSRFLRLRQELFEIDVRYGQLGDQGIFAALDRANVLDHRVPGVAPVQPAILDPPAEGRARLRGQCVRRFYTAPQRYRCDWMGVWDLGENRQLDLSDPFAEQENWQNMAREEPSRPVDLRGMLDQALLLYDRGDYERAHEVLGALGCLQSRFGTAERHDFLRYSAWVQARRGMLDGTNLLDQVYRDRPMVLIGVTDYLCVCRYQGLSPPPVTQTWIDRGHEILALEPRREPGTAATFFGHVGYTLLRWGDVERGRLALLQAHRADRFQRAHAHTQVRILAELAEAHRRVDDLGEAGRFLDEAEAMHATHDYRGDLADFTWTYRAKLASDRVQADALLERAKAAQFRLGNRMGVIRSMLLQARLAGASSQAMSSREWIEQTVPHLPALARCSRLAKILQQWETWTSGDLQPDEQGDIFWGV